MMYQLDMIDKITRIKLQSRVTPIQNTSTTTFKNGVGFCFHALDTG